MFEDGGENPYEFAGFLNMPYECVSFRTEFRMNPRMNMSHNFAAFLNLRMDDLHDLGRRPNQNFTFFSLLFFETFS